MVQHINYLLCSGHYIECHSIVHSPVLTDLIIMIVSLFIVCDPGRFLRQHSVMHKNHYHTNLIELVLTLNIFYE